MGDQSKRNSFTGSIGFILSAAGSAVGLGNIWRFPYLAARNGGGLFLLIYILLALTFGYTLLTTEIAIGRRTRQSPLTAYRRVDRRMGWIGIFACVVPAIILPYYCAIGGWVLKYFLVFLTGHGTEAAADGYFSAFISGQTEPIVMAGIFLAVTALVIYRGVERGIEASSKVLMPLLLLLVIIIAVFSLTMKSDSAGEVRTGLQGLKILVIPDLSSLTLSGLFGVITEAMGQLFYSLSVAMGIMIAYGSYVSDDTDLGQSINCIEIFDTLIAFLAGVMIIPAVYVFSGIEGMSAGPSLMFITLPKLFASMGRVGSVIGCLFFAMVLFAALTSSVSIMEAVVSSFMDRFGMSRRRAFAAETVIAAVAAVIVCLGYNVLYFNVTLPNGASAQILDIMDYVSNNILMPVVSIGTCILIGWMAGADTVIGEVEKNGHVMGRKGLYRIMIRYVAPVLLSILLLKSLGIL